MSEPDRDAAAPDGRGTQDDLGGLPQVRLVRRDKDVLVLPAAAAQGGGLTAQSDFEPFPLAQLPKLLTDQLALFCELLHRRHGRCVGALLLLDGRAREWSFRIPAQRCGRTASCWSALARDVHQTSGGVLLAGTYQSRVLDGGEDVADAVPPCDGVHLVHVISPQRQSIWTFVRAEGVTRRVPAEDVVFDDLEAALQECLPRLTFTS